MNLLHNVGAVDISGLRDTVREWSPSLSDMLFVAVGDTETPDAALPDGNAADEAADATLPDEAQDEAGDAQTGADDAASGLAPVSPVG